MTVNGYTARCGRPFATFAHHLQSDARSTLLTTRSGEPRLNRSLSYPDDTNTTGSTRHQHDQPRTRPGGSGSSGCRASHSGDCLVGVDDDCLVIDDFVGLTGYASGPVISADGGDRGYTTPALPPSRAYLAGRRNRPCLRPARAHTLGPTTRNLRHARLVAKLCAQRACSTSANMISCRGSGVCFLGMPCWIMHC